MITSNFELNNKITLVVERKFGFAHFKELEFSYLQHSHKFLTRFILHDLSGLNYFSCQHLKFRHLFDKRLSLAKLSKKKNARWIEFKFLM